VCHGAVRQHFEVAFAAIVNIFAIRPLVEFVPVVKMNVTSILLLDRVKGIISTGKRPDFSSPELFYCNSLVRFIVDPTIHDHISRGHSLLYNVNPDPAVTLPKIATTFEGIIPVQVPIPVKLINDNLGKRCGPLVGHQPWFTLI
jgi:hypothetical protein